MSSSVGANWLLPRPVEPVANLASRVIEQENLRIPIPVEELAGSVAEIEECAWPYDCDAIVVGLLDSESPTIFLKQGINRRRRRFTLAHELGHIEISWHVGELACHLSETASFDVEPLRAARDPDDILARSRIREQEAEATRFASYLLMPEAILRPIVATGDMRHVFEQANLFDVSVQAFILRLRAMLQPGFIFTHHDSGGRRIYATSGTVWPSGSGTDFDALQVKEHSTAHGVGHISGRTVHWFQLAKFEKLEDTHETRSSTQILRDLLTEFISDPLEQQSIFASINGIAGGSLSRPRATSADQVLSLLRHKFSDFRRQDIVCSPTFDVYLRRKTEDWELKNSVQASHDPGT